MKSNFMMALMLASAFNSGFAEGTLSTLAQRAEVLKAFEKDPKQGLEAINQAQQEGSLKADADNYVVVIEKDGDVYKRVAHFDKEKLKLEQQTIETSLLSVVQDAEAKLAGGTGPIAFSFSASNKTMHAILAKRGNLLIFNICPTQEEVDLFLKAATPTADKVPVTPVVAEEKKPEEVKVEGKIVEDKPVVLTEAPKVEATTLTADKAPVTPVVAEEKKPEVPKA